MGWALLVAVVLFWRLGAASFWDPDEAHYAQTTRELIESRDWLAPHYNHQPFFDKPVLFHLFQALPMRLFGPTELAARLVPALAALALIAMTWWLGLTLGSAEIGLMGGLLLTVSPAVFALSRYGILETLFTAFLFGGMSLLAVAALAERPRLQYGGYVLIACATLTKGPLALVLGGLTFLIAIAASADARERLLGLRWAVGLAIVSAVSVPWFLYMLHRFGSEFVEAYVLNENVRLYGSPPYAGQPEWWFYFRIVAVGMLPWTGILVGRLVDDIRGARTRRDPPDTFEVLLWSWTIAVVGFFTVSRFKLDHYVFPVAPALCLLCARAWADARAVTTDRIRTGSTIGVRLVGPLLIVAGLVAAIFIRLQLDLPLAALVAPSSFIVAGLLLIGRSIVPKGRARESRVPWIVLSAFGVAYAALLLWVLPTLEEEKVVPDMARWIASHAEPADRVAGYRLNRWDPAFRFYVERRTTVLNTPEQAHAFFAEEPPFYCMMLAHEFEYFVARGVPLQVVYARRGLWATSGRALWRRRAPPAHFVIVTRAGRRHADHRSRGLLRPVLWPLDPHFQMPSARRTATS